MGGDRPGLLPWAVRCSTWAGSGLRPMARGEGRGPVRRPVPWLAERRGGRPWDAGAGQRGRALAGAGQCPPTRGAWRGPPRRRSWRGPRPCPPARRSYGVDMPGTGVGVPGHRGGGSGTMSPGPQKCVLRPPGRSCAPKVAENLGFQIAPCAVGVGSWLKLEHFRAKPSSARGRGGDGFEAA
jgi:hypothetical protein